MIPIGTIWPSVSSFREVGSLQHSSPFSVVPHSAGPFHVQQLRDLVEATRKNPILAHY